MPDYRVFCVHADRSSWLSEVRSAIEDELRSIAEAGRSLVEVVDGYVAGEAGRPAVALYFGSTAGAASEPCWQLLEQFIDSDVVVVPCIERGADLFQHVPAIISDRNAWWWEDPTPAIRLARFALESLGIEERQRAVFISHRRSDAIEMAEQLHDALAKHRFRPFVDRFDIAPAESVQRRLMETLDEMAFVLLIESPDVHDSKWVLEEVDHALEHSLGLLILTWPDTDPVRGTEDLPRRHLLDDELQPGPLGQRILGKDVVREIVDRVESVHAAALARRRRRLVLSTKELAMKAGWRATELPGWVLLAEKDPSPDGTDPLVTGGSTLVTFTPRLPEPSELYRLDVSCRAALPNTPVERGLLVHAGSDVPPDRAALLEWCAGDRQLAVVPDSAVLRCFQP